MGKRFTYYAVGSSFHPLNLAGTQLYYAKNTATPSLWNDQSPNAFDLTQAVASKQPTIGTDTVDFDGINDNQTAIVSSPISSDTDGIVYFSGLLQTGVNSYFFTYARNTTNNTFFAIEIVSNAIRVIIRENSLTINNIILSANTFASGYIYGYIKSNGSNYELMVEQDSKNCIDKIILQYGIKKLLGMYVYALKESEGRVLEGWIVDVYPSRHLLIKRNDVNKPVKFEHVISVVEK